MQINWYPGHMARAKRLLIQQLSRVDVVIELCDARLPYSSRNPDLNGLVRNKERILLLNKADLADPAKTQDWQQYFQRQGIRAAEYVSTAGKVNKALGLIEQAARQEVEKAAQKGVKKTVRAMVVGVPNVGKSTFINRLHGGNVAKVGDRPGVTRSNQWVKVTPYLELMDTPGLLWPRLDDQLAAQRLCYIGAIRDEIMDTQMLAIHLLQDLLAASPEAVITRYKLKDASLRGAALLEEACRGRGFLLRGGFWDMDRGAGVVLDEFRAGKLGRVTLEQVREENPKEPRYTIRGADKISMAGEDRRTQDRPPQDRRPQNCRTQDRPPQAQELNDGKA